MFRGVRRRAFTCRPHFPAGRPSPIPVASCSKAGSHACPLDLPSSSTLKTVCVGTWDGYYFPVSYATVVSRFGEDERPCRRLCPAADVALYTHRNPGEEIEQAVSMGGRPYTELPTAF